MTRSNGTTGAAAAKRLHQATRGVSALLKERDALAKEVEELRAEVARWKYAATQEPDRDEHRALTNALFPRETDEERHNRLRAFWSHFREEMQDATRREQILNRFSLEQRRVIELRWGPEPWSLDQIGEAVGRTRERVRQIENQALKQYETEELRAMSNGVLSF